MRKEYDFSKGIFVKRHPKTELGRRFLHLGLKAAALGVDRELIEKMLPEIDSLTAQLEAAEKVIEVIRHERVYKNPEVRKALAAYDAAKEEK